MKTQIDNQGYSYAEFCKELIDVTKPVPHLDLTGFLVRLVVGHPHSTSEEQVKKTIHTSSETTIKFIYTVPFILI